FFVQLLGVAVVGSLPRGIAHVGSDLAGAFCVHRGLEERARVLVGGVPGSGVAASLEHASLSTTGFAERSIVMCVSRQRRDAVADCLCLSGLAARHALIILFDTS